MSQRLFTHVSYSRVPDVGLRFTNDPDGRPAGLPDDPWIRFFELPRPMSKTDAADWLRAQPYCNTPDWQEAIARQLREHP